MNAVEEVGRIVDEMGNNQALSIICSNIHTQVYALHRNDCPDPTDTERHRGLSL